VVRIREEGDRQKNSPPSDDARGICGRRSGRNRALDQIGVGAFDLSSTEGGIFFNEQKKGEGVD